MSRFSLCFGVYLVSCVLEINAFGLKATEIPTLPKKTAKGGYFLQRHDNCERPIQTIEECTKAGQLLIPAQKGINASDDKDMAGMTSDPSNCYFEGKVLFFNKNETNKGFCSQEDVCVCKETYKNSCSETCVGRFFTGGPHKGKSVCSAEECNNAGTKFINQDTFGCQSQGHLITNSPCCDVSWCGLCEQSCVGKLMADYGHPGQLVCEVEECANALAPYINVNTFGCSGNNNGTAWGAENREADLCCDTRRCAPPTPSPTIKKTGPPCVRCESWGCLPYGCVGGVKN